MVRSSRHHPACARAARAIRATDGRQLAMTSPSLRRHRQVQVSGWEERSRRVGEVQGDFQLRSTGVTASMVRWRVLQARVEQLRHRTNVGAAWRQPSRSPRQRPPATTIIAAPFSGSAALHRPLGPPQPVQLRRQRPGAVLQILQIAVAVERPAVKTAGQATPVAGLGSARTGVVGLGPARAAAGLAEPRTGRDGDLPGPARLPAPHEASPPLARCQAPTNPPSKRARPSRSASLTHRTLRRYGLPGRA
jgi:hypothetical protein